METTEKWYHQTGWIIALIILFFPVGLYLLWTSKKLSVGMKALITVIYIGLVTAGMCMDNYKYAKKIQRIFKEAFR
ncbi:MAG TPA: hypothetical protein VD905_11650 [Flavobacteriales bacterium]|nr:hypothetical protein [Flavobacteriales bacterium]